MSRVVPKSGEDVGPTRRRPMTPARKRRIHAFWGGCCVDCGDPVPVDGPGVIYEHEITVWMGGDDDDGPNVKVRCTVCNAIKTAKDMAAIAKVKRLRGETGAGPRRVIPSPAAPWPPGSRPWPSRPFPKRRKT